MEIARALNPRGWLLGGAHGKEALWIAWQRAAPGVVSFTTVLVDGIAGGGYFPRAWRLTSFALLALERESLPVLLAGVLGGITAVAGYGLGTYLLYGRHHLNPIEGKLLFEPLGYANALGIYAAIGILLAFGLALTLRPPLLRLACLAPVGILAPSLYLTESRAAELSLALGLLVLVRFGRRIPRPVMAAVAVGAAAAIVAVAVAIAHQEHNLAARLAGANRPHYWHVAWHEVELNPVLGSGAFA